MAAWKEGFARSCRAPLAVVAEIAWRWAFGATMLLLTVIAAAQFAKSLTVTDAELEALRGQNFWLGVGAILHIFEGTGQKLMMLLAILAPAAFVWWVVTASFGRAGTLRLLRGAGPSGTPRFYNPPAAIFALSFLRALGMVATILSLFAAMRLAGNVAQGDPPKLALFYIVFLVLALLISLAWSVVNWYLSLAPIFIAGHGASMMDAIRDAVTFGRDRRGDLGSLELMFVLLKTGAAVLAIGLSALPFAVPGAPAMPIIMALMAITMMYFAVVDWLYLARLGGYLALAEESAAQAADASTSERVLAQAK